MTNKITPELKTELVQLASNIKHFVDAFNEGDDKQIQSFTSTGLVPKFLSDLVKDKLVLAQDTCDFDISEMTKQLTLRGPKYDLTSDIKADNGKVYQSFKTSNTYTEDYEEISYSEGYLSGSNGRLLIKEDMPILYKALSDYRKGYTENSIDEEKAYKSFCKQNDVDPDALYRGDIKGFEIKNQAIKDSIVHQERTEFMDKFGFDKVCKDIEKSLKEHFVIDNKKTNKNTI
jgi:hypothetical protein